MPPRRMGVCSCGLIICFFTLCLFKLGLGYNCDWGLGEHVRRFVRVPENVPVGFTAFKVNVSKPELLILRPLKDEAEGLLSPTASGGIGRVIVSSSLGEVLTEEEGSSVLKFTLSCGNNPVSQQVTVYIDDVNNRKPTFLDRNISVVVDEMTPTGLLILSEIRVYDGDKASTANSEIELFIEDQLSAYTDDEDIASKLKSVNGDAFGGGVTPGRGRPQDRQETDEYFQMTDHKKGEIQLIKPLDFDEGPRKFYLKISAKDMGDPPLVSSTWIQVRVKDSDDLNPKFTHSVYTSVLHEHPGPDIGETVQEHVKTSPEPVKAYDGDLGINATLKYGIMPGDLSDHFTIDESTGDLYLTKHLDRELSKDDTIILHLFAKQVDNSAREGFAEVRIHVKDVNDHLPYFENDVYSISIVENLPSGFSVVQVAAFDPDLGENGKFSYFVKSHTESAPLAVNPETGWLTVANQSMLDREYTQDLSMEVCTTQALPVVYLSKDIATGKFNVIKKQVDSPEDLELALSEVGGELSTRNGNQRTITATVEPPAAITVQSISSSVRALPPSVLLRERLQRQTDVASGSRFAKSRVQTPEESLGKLLATRRILSRAEVVLPNSSSSSVPKKIVKRDTKITRGFRDKNGRFIPIRYHQRNGTLESPCALIKLTLLDANDNNPVFVPDNHYEFTIFDDKGTGELLGTVKAVDKDSGTNGMVKYHLQSQSKGDAKLAVEFFEINEHSGEILVKSPLIPGHVTLFVEGSDSPSSPSEARTSLAVVSVNIKSRNDNEPEFLGAPYEFWVGAEAPVGTSVGQVRVSTADSKFMSFDMFHSYSEEVPFGIEETSGIVAVTKPLEDYPRTAYNLEALVAIPTGDRSGNKDLYTNVTIHVAPHQRAASQRDITITYSIPENLSGGRVGDVLRSLRAVGINLPRDPIFQLLSPESKEFFSLADDGILFTVAPLDFETKDSHTIVVISSRTSMIFYIVVQVTDLNDNPPQFNAVRYEGSLKENEPAGTTVAVTPHIQVTDLDSYAGSSWTLWISGEFHDHFAFKKETNEIIFIGREVDREKTPSYHLLLTATDNGNLTSSANLTIKVEDVNDNRPNFLHLYEPRYEYDDTSFRAIDGTASIWDLTVDKESNLRIPETIPLGSKILQVMAKDYDIGLFGDIEYDIVKQVVLLRSQRNATFDSIIPVESEDFVIQPKTGAIIVAKKLISESLYLINISATDGGGLQSMTYVGISVYDVNDHSPKFRQPSYGFEVMEGEYLVAEVGQVAASDEDIGENGRLTYSIVIPENLTYDNFPFQITETGGTILISGVVDREVEETYTFIVKAEDGGTPHLSDSAEVRIFIGDVNDHPPEFMDFQGLVAASETSPIKVPVYRSTISEAAPPGTIITKVRAEDLDKPRNGGGTLILYKIENGSPSLAVDSEDGTVYTTGRLDYETEPILQATIVAHDMGEKPLSSTSLLSILVEDVENELNIRVFPQTLYEVHALENSKVPQRLARIQLSPNIPKDKNFYIRLTDSSMLSIIHLDPLSGDLLLVRSLDREEQLDYKFKIRAVETGEGRSQDTVIYYEPSHQSDPNGEETTVVLVTSNGTLTTPRERNGDNLFRGIFTDEMDAVTLLGLDEAWVHLVVNDVNDNPPSFFPPGDAIVTAISSDALIGDTVTNIQAVDPDEGLNGQVKYELLPTTISSRSISYFSLDTATGELKVAGELKDLAGEMVNFDVKAQDRRGDEDGLSSRTSVFIHILQESSQLVMEVNAPPHKVQEHAHMIQSLLTNVSGYEIHFQKILPHVEGDQASIQETDIYVYGVDPLTKELIGINRVKNFLENRNDRISSMLPMEISVTGIRTPLLRTTRKLLKNAELAILVGALVVFLACVAAIACLCYKQRKIRRKPMPLPPGMSLGIATTTNGVPILQIPYTGHYPAQYTHISENSDSSDSTHIHADQLDGHGKPHECRNTKVYNVQQRKPNKAMPPISHIDDDNGHWRQRMRHKSDDQMTEIEEGTPQVHRRPPTRTTHWHFKDSSVDPDENLGRNVRSSIHNIKHSHNHCRDSCSHSQRNLHNRCGRSESPPGSPDSLERTQQREPFQAPSTSAGHQHRKNVYGRFPSDVTEL